jgi:hypothetical protein
MMMIIPIPPGYQQPAYAPAPVPQAPDYGGYGGYGVPQPMGPQPMGPQPMPPQQMPPQQMAPQQPIAPPGYAPETPALPPDMLNELPLPTGDASLPAGGGSYGPGAIGLPQLLTIPCPNGHELETPQEYLGEFAMCPICQAQFDLVIENSLEYKRRREAEQEAIDERRGKLWFRWSIAFAVIVLLGLVALIALSSK